MDDPHGLIELGDSIRGTFLILLSWGPYTVLAILMHQFWYHFIHMPIRWEEFENGGTSSCVGCLMGWPLWIFLVLIVPFIPYYLFAVWAGIW